MCVENSVHELWPRHWRDPFYYSFEYFCSPARSVGRRFSRAKNKYQICQRRRHKAIDERERYGEMPCVSVLHDRAALIRIEEMNSINSWRSKWCNCVRIDSQHIHLIEIKWDFRDLPAARAMTHRESWYFEVWTVSCAAHTHRKTSKWHNHVQFVRRTHWPMASNIFMIKIWSAVHLT